MRPVSAPCTLREERGGGGAGEQELAGRLIAVDHALDGEDQVGKSSDLVDEDRPVEPGEEPGWIGLRGLAGALVVHADDLGRVLGFGDRLAERALSNLSRAHHHHDASVVERLQDSRAYLAFDHA